ncbi:MAG: polyprenyl synthetase family protein, partial [Alphaproteobacteria bacterium]
EGKITLPLVLAYRRGSDADRTFWRRVVEQNDIQDGDLEHAIDLLKQHRALDDTIDRARHFGSVARDALAPFPQSEFKSALLEVVEFCIERAH